MDKFIRTDLKKRARAYIKGNVISLFAANLLVDLLVGSAIFFRDIYLVLIPVLVFTCVLEFGLSGIYLKFGEKGVIDYKQLFIPYKSVRRFIRHFTTFVIKYVIILLSATLLLIPGLIKRYAYSQVKYLRAAEPDYSSVKCLFVSKRMMKWHKFELFLLDVTFLPLFILAPLTGGLLLIYLLPYYSTTMAKYHLHLRSRFEINREINRGFIGYFVNYLNHMR